jgi:polysaccharide deacetylase family protein (PEP-CTERM system associated)
METPKVRNALSFDVEEWYQGMLQVDPGEWPRYEDRLAYSLDQILKLLAEKQVKATFFVLGYVAEKQPALVGQIIRGGHELASHGYQHRLVYRQSPEEFRDDVSRSKKILESISGCRVKGYRAPFFSVTKKSLWALRVLEELGFEYDSSVFPTSNFLYGIPDAPRFIYKAGGIAEFPLSVARAGRFNFPACGGFYLRALPYWLSRYGIRSFNRQGEPAVVYLHPWEIDADKPRIAMKPKWKLIHEYNINTARGKLSRLLCHFSFGPLSEVLNERGKRGIKSF